MLNTVHLKSIPPRSPVGFIARPHLALERFRLAGIQLIEISAPDGFGKTSQLAQWHREASAAGAAAMWLSLDEHDEADRLIHGLTTAAAQQDLRVSADWMGNTLDHQEAITRWLAEIASSPRDNLLILDDVDRLPERSRLEVVNYLLANNANNLRIILSSRPNTYALQGADIGGVPLIRLTARELRFKEEETTAVVAHALTDLSQAQVAELSVRIHALTDGWPLGVRLAVASRLHNDTNADWELSVSANINQYFKESVLDRLSEETHSMLIRIAEFDPIRPDLCQAVLGPTAPVQELGRLVDASPVLTQSGDGNWLRLHPIAREILVDAQSMLPKEERRLLASSAERWYADHGLFEEAARQAILANDRAAAMRLAEASLRNMLIQGRLGEVLAWFERASRQELEDRSGFWAPAAWALAMSNRPSEARELVAKILASSDLTEAAQFEADLILGFIAGFGDDLRQLKQLVDDWPRPPESTDGGAISIYYTSQANYDLLRGQVADLRTRWKDAEISNLTSSPVARGFSDLFYGLSYLWEGKPELAYESLRGALFRAEQEMARSNRVVSMIAAVLAQACLQTDRVAEANLHLALRLPVIEKRGLPDTVIAAFCTVAELADDDGRQDQAEVQLESLAAIGRKRKMVRIEAAGLLGLARFHALHNRATSALEAADRLEAVRSTLSQDTVDEIRLWVELHSKMALAHAKGIGENREFLRDASAAAEEAAVLAKRLNRGSELLEARLLRSQIQARLGQPIPGREFEEISEQCKALGMLRLLRLSGLAQRDGSPSGLPLGVAQGPDGAPNAIKIDQDRSFLTAREHEMLPHLATRMSNKEIAIAMGLGEETVKWHLKNLFRKLEAGDRRTAASRARALGLL